MTLVQKGTEGLARGVDDRLGSSNFVRRSLNKVFPDHWSFMLGEMALYTFIILLLTGSYLALFYTPARARGGPPPPPSSPGCCPAAPWPCSTRPRSRRSSTRAATCRSRASR